MTMTDKINIEVSRPLKQNELAVLRDSIQRSLYRDLKFAAGEVEVSIDAEMNQEP